MSTRRADPNEELQRQINELVPPGAKVIAHERETPDGPLHCLIFQHGSRRHVVEERQPFTAADIPMIVRAVEQFVAMPKQRNRGRAWTDDPAMADALFPG